MAMISREKIDELIQTADIVDVVSDFVSLQPSGKSMKGLCPFHSEKTPSFHVSKEKQIFNCFGCHKKGNVITFIEEYKHLDFVDAVHFLADRYHFDLGETQSNVERYNFKKLYEVNKRAKDFYNLNLLNLESGRTALQYLENRELDQQTLNAFNIGYAPATGNQLLKNLKENFQEFELVEAGLVSRNDSGNYFDVFRDRIVFPILNEQGQVLGFSGRILKDDKTQPKYINTQATKIFNKGKILYNLDKALPYINQRKRLVLMEGFFDVIQAYKAGVEESVCTMGTELTIDQVKKIKKYTDDVVICYDGDQAGQQATYRAMQMLEKMNLNVQIAIMPNGLDPDDYIKQNSSVKFRNQINQNLVDKYDFVYQMIIEKGLSSSSEIESAKHQLFKFLLASASTTITTIYLHKFAEEIHLDHQIIERDYQKYIINKRRYQTVENAISHKPKKSKVSKRLIQAEEKLISFYLQSDAYRDMIEEAFKEEAIDFIRGPRKQIIQAMRVIYESKNKLDLAMIKSDMTDDMFQHLKEMILSEKYQYSDFELNQLIDTLTLEKLDRDVQQLSKEVTELYKTDFNKLAHQEQELIKKEIQEKTKLTKEKNQIKAKIVERRKETKPAV